MSSLNQIRIFYGVREVVIGPSGVDLSEEMDRLV